MLPRMLPAAATSPFDKPRFEASDSSPYDMQSGPIVHVAVLVGRTEACLRTPPLSRSMRADGRERGTRLTDEHTLTQAALRCNAATSASYFAMAWDTTCSSANATSPGEDSSSGSVRDDA
jgi:hypothetical protein